MITRVSDRVLRLADPKIVQPAVLVNDAIPARSGQRWESRGFPGVRLQMEEPLGERLRRVTLRDPEVSRFGDRAAIPGQVHAGRGR